MTIHDTAQITRDYIDWLQVFDSTHCNRCNLCNLCVYTCMARARVKCCETPIDYAYIDYKCWKLLN